MEQTKPQPNVTGGYVTPKHVFLQLLMIAMLYASVVAAITLYFQYANQIFFDSAFTYRESIYSGIRWGSSVLLVAFPVLVYTSWLIQKEINRQALVRQMKTRRWLLYFTQFVTAITIIVDIMILIYEFYGGEITARFVSKIIVVLVIAAIVLGYYRWELHRTEALSPLPKLMAISVGLVIAGSVIGGFFIAGTPAEQRAVRLDDQRISNLSEIQNQVINYLQTKNELPTDQITLENWAGFLPTDPVTTEPYRYSKTSATTFELCATFASELVDDIYGSHYYETAYGPVYGEKAVPQLVGGSSWLHPVGDYCFDRTIE